MGLMKFIKEEIQVVQERDPAIKSPIEVILYPTFRVMLSYRRAHKLYQRGHFFVQGTFLSGQQEKQGLRYIRERKLERVFL